ncbi:hypothetical protein GN956_G18946, partial [Arapaima gigas]
IQLPHKLEGPHAVILRPGVEQLHVVADQVDADRVQLLLAQRAGAVVVLPRVLVGEELGEHQHQKPGGKVPDRQAALVVALQLLFREQVLLRNVEVRRRDFKLVKIDGHQPCFFGPSARFLV